MRAFQYASKAFALAALYTTSVLADVDPIVIKVRCHHFNIHHYHALSDLVLLQGSKFFYKTNGTEL